MRQTKEILLDLGMLKPAQATVYFDVLGTRVVINEVIAKWVLRDGSTRLEDVLHRMKTLALGDLEAKLMDLHCIQDAVETWDMPDGPGAA